MKTPLFALAAAAVLSFTAGARADQIVTESVTPAAPAATVTERSTTVTPAAPVVTDTTTATTTTTTAPAVSKHDQKEIDEARRKLEKKEDKADRNATFGK